MIGAILGDIVSSVYEWRDIKTKEFSLFRDDCFFTDDTVMTTAVADAMMQGEKIEGGIDWHETDLSPASPFWSYFDFRRLSCPHVTPWLAAAPSLSCPPTMPSPSP